MVVTERFQVGKSGFAQREVITGRPRVILLECHGSHGECLEFQIEAWSRSGVQLEVWTHPAHAGQRRFDRSARHVVLERPIVLSVARRLWLSPPSLLVINTATGPSVRNLLLLLHPLRIPTVGIFHDVDKLHSPSANLMARMIDGRLMLAEHLARRAEAEVGVPFDYAHFLSSHGRMEPGHQEFLIAVPGAFSPEKKDIATLLALARDPGLDARVRFVLLGRFPQTPAITAWWEQCRAHAVDHRFVRFTEFVPQPVFDSYLARSFAVLPLMGPSCGHYTRFRSDKVSGAVNLALGFARPLLIPSDLASQWLFGPSVMTYDGVDELAARINQLSDQSRRAGTFAEIAASAEANISFQQSLYLKACLGAAHRAHDRSGPSPTRVRA